MSEGPTERHDRRADALCGEVRRMMSAEIARRGFSRSEVCRQLGLGANSLGDTFTGRKAGLTLRTLCRIAGVLGLDVEVRLVDRKKRRAA